MTKNSVKNVDIEKLVKTIEKEFKTSEGVGLGISFFTKDDVILEQGFGKRDVENDLAYTKETKFPIASCTKSFTATALIALVSDKKLDLDVPIKEYIPEFEMYDDYTTKNTTTRDILSHTTGLPHHQFLFMNKDWKYNDIFKRLPHLRPLHKFRYVFHYCNVHFLIATNLLERVSGKSYEDFLTKRILDPLKMTETTFTIKDYNNFPNIAKGYVRANDKLQSVDYLELGNIAKGAGNLNSSLSDMRKWVQLHLNSGKVGSKQIISKEAMKELYKIQKINHNNPYFRVWPDTNYVLESGYSLGWSVTAYRGSHIIKHFGSGSGIQTNVGFMPYEGVGFVLTSNDFGNNMPVYFDLYFADVIKKLEPIDWGTKIREYERKMNEIISKNMSKQEELYEPIPYSKKLELYVGKYYHPGYGMLEFFTEDNHLFVAYGKDTKYKVDHINEEKFTFTVKDFQAKMNFEFCLESPDKISGLLIKAEPTLEPAVFKRKE